MRPTRVVLLVDADPIARSLRRFVLRVWGYNVLGAGAGRDAWEIAEERPIDVLVIEGQPPDMSIATLVRGAHARCPQLRSLVIGAEIESANASLRSKAPAATEVRQQLRVLSARKRGPAPTSKREPASASAAPEDVRHAA